MFAGLDLLPERWDPIADYFPDEEVRDALARIRDQIAQGLRSSTSHQDFINHNCRAADYIKAGDWAQRPWSCHPHEE
jgi:hypothetical protein